VSAAYSHSVLFVRRRSDRLKSAQVKSKLRVAADGRLRLPRKTTEEWGLKPGDEIEIDLSQQGGRGAAS
jgi:hypothetical protein